MLQPCTVCCRDNTFFLYAPQVLLIINYHNYYSNIPNGHDIHVHVSNNNYYIVMAWRLCTCIMYVHVHY